MKTDPEYLLGTDDEELVRLGIQHRLWAESAAKLWEQARIMPGSRVLDAGCGPGYATLDFAQLVGADGQVVGVDESPPFVEHLRRTAEVLNMHNIEAHQGDVQHLEQVLMGTEPFDAAWIRWVLCFLPDPEPVIASIAGLLRPGGRLAVQDYFNYRSMTLGPRRPIFTEVIQAIGESWSDTGDLDVVARLPAAMRRNNLRMIDLSVTQRVARPHEPAWQWPTVFWRSFLPRLVKSGHLVESQRGEFMAMWEEASQDPDTFMVLPPVFGVVAERI